MDVLILILIIIISISTISFIYCVYNIYGKHLDLKTKNFYDQIDFDSKHVILQKIIDDEMELYKILNVNCEKDKYFNEAVIKDMTIKVTAKVYERITPSIKYNLSLIYDVSTDEKLMLVIGGRVSLEVLGYSVEQNKDFEE